MVKLFAGLLGFFLFSVKFVVCQLIGPVAIVYFAHWLLFSKSLVDVSEVSLFISRTLRCLKDQWLY